MHAGVRDVPYTTSGGSAVARPPANPCRSSEASLYLQHSGRYAGAQQHTPSHYMWRRTAVQAFWTQPPDDPMSVTRRGE